MRAICICRPATRRSAPSREFADECVPRPQIMSGFTLSAHTCCMNKFLYYKRFALNRIFLAYRIEQNLWNCGGGARRRSRKPRMALPRTPLSPQDKGVLNEPDLVIPSAARDLQFAATCRSLAALGMTRLNVSHYKTYSTFQPLTATAVSARWFIIINSGFPAIIRHGVI